MSGNRRKKTTGNFEGQPADAAEASVASRLVVMPKTQEKQAPNQAKKQRPERIGDILREARLERADDLYHIAEYLCIKPTFLNALENSQYDKLPADAYVIGFLRTYANFLGVDGKEAVDRYRYEMAGQRKKPTLSMPMPLSEGQAPSALILIGAGLVILLIYALWYGISSANRTGVETQHTPPLLSSVTDTGTIAEVGVSTPPPASEPASEVTATTTLAATVPAGIVVTSAPASPPTAAPTPAPAPVLKADEPPQADKEAKKRTFGTTDSDSRLTIRASQSSWVMVTDASGRAIFDHVMKIGDVYKVPNTQGLRLTTGNGSGIVLSLDGTDLPRLSTGTPHVVRDIPLDPARLTTESPASPH